MAPVVLPLAQETSHEGWVGSAVTASALLSGGGWGPGWSGAHGDVRIAGSRMAPVELCWERGLQSRPLGPPLTSTPPAGTPCAAWLGSPPFPAGLAPDSLPIVFLRGRDSGPHAAPQASQCRAPRKPSLPAAPAPPHPASAGPGLHVRFCLMSCASRLTAPAGPQAPCRQGRVLPAAREADRAMDGEVSVPRRRAHHRPLVGS